MEREQRPRKATNPSTSIFLFKRKNVSVVSLRRYKMIKFIHEIKEKVVNYIKKLLDYEF